MSMKQLYLLATAAVCACASASNPQQDASAAPVTSTRKSNFLGSEEIAAAHADGGNIHDAILRLRPNWLVAHGVAGQGAAGMEYASVYVDGQQVGNPNALRDIQAYHVGDVTYYDVTQAGARFGIHAGTGGVIDVRLKMTK